MNGEQMAPIDPASPRMVPIWVPVKPRPPSAVPAVRYRAASGSQAPQTMYWRNIISERRPTFDFIGAPGLGRSVGQGRRSEYAPAGGRCEVAPDSSMLGFFAIHPGNGHHDEETAVKPPVACRRPAPG